MYAAAVNAFPKTDIAILCAAVADFTPRETKDVKIKREKGDMAIQLVPTKDIAAELGRMKKESQFMVGFALETNDETNNAINKLKAKKLDFIVLNSLNDKGAGFSVDTNKITIISDTSKYEYPLKPKREVAKDIIDKICELYK